MIPWLGVVLATDEATTSNRPIDHGPALNALALELEELLDDERVAGAAMAAVDPGSGTWTRVFGHANREEKRPVELSTRFQAGERSGYHSGVQYHHPSVYIQE